MEYAFSIRCGRAVAASDCDYEDTADMLLICPHCGNSVFKVEGHERLAHKRKLSGDRIVGVAGSSIPAFFSHHDGKDSPTCAAKDNKKDVDEAVEARLSKFRGQLSAKMGKRFWVSLESGARNMAGAKRGEYYALAHLGAKQASGIELLGLMTKDGAHLGGAIVKTLGDDPMLKYVKQDVSENVYRIIDLLWKDHKSVMGAGSGESSWPTAAAPNRHQISCDAAAAYMFASNQSRIRADALDMALYFLLSRSGAHGCINLLNDKGIEPFAAENLELTSETLAAAVKLACEQLARKTLANSFDTLAMLRTGVSLVLSELIVLSDWAGELDLRF